MELGNDTAASRRQGPAAGNWRTTRTSMLLGAKQRDSKALAALCQVYWQPVYGFIRAHGVSHDLALDVTQGVFDNLLRRDLRTLDLERGSRFRHWLKRVARSHLFNVLKKTRRVSGVEVSGVELEAVPDAAICAADTAFDQQTALVLMDRAWARLHCENYADRPLLFEHVKQSLSAEETRMTDSELSAHLGQCDSYVRGVCKRVKDKEFPQVLRDELTEIGVSRRRLNEELRALLLALS